MGKKKRAEQKGKRAYDSKAAPAAKEDGRVAKWRSHPSCYQDG